MAHKPVPSMWRRDWNARIWNSYASFRDQTKHEHRIDHLPAALPNAVSTFDLNPQNQTPEHLSSTLSRQNATSKHPAPTELNIYTLRNAHKHPLLVVCLKSAAVPCLEVQNPTTSDMCASLASDQFHMRCTRPRRLRPQHATAPTLCPEGRRDH